MFSGDPNHLVLKHVNITNLNMTRPPKQPSNHPNIVSSVPNIIIALLAIVLNIAELLMIICKKQMKPFERILISLCIADIVIPLMYAVETFYTYQTTRKLYGDQDFIIYHNKEYFAILSSITNIIALGVDRLLAVKYPLKNKIWMTKRKINVMIVAAWVSSIALSLLCNTESFINGTSRTPAYIFAGVSFASGITITVLYAAIIRTMMRRRKTAVNMSVKRSVQADESAVTITCLNVVIAFSICTYPHLIEMLIHPIPTLPIKFILLNTLLDPVVYYFRGYLKKVFYKRSCVHESIKSQDSRLSKLSSHVNSKNCTEIDL